MGIALRVSLSILQRMFLKGLFMRMFYQITMFNKWVHFTIFLSHILHITAHFIIIISYL